MVKFPKVEVQLTGCDGNAFAVIGAVCGAMRRAEKRGDGPTNDDVSEFKKEAMNGDYDHLLQTAMATVTVY